MGDPFAAHTKRWANLHQDLAVLEKEQDRVREEIRNADHRHLLSFPRLMSETKADIDQVWNNYEQQILQLEQQRDKEIAKLQNDLTERVDREVRRPSDVTTDLERQDDDLGHRIERKLANISRLQQHAEHDPTDSPSATPLHVAPRSRGSSDASPSKCAIVPQNQFHQSRRPQTQYNNAPGTLDTRVRASGPIDDEPQPPRPAPTNIDWRQAPVGPAPSKGARYPTPDSRILETTAYSNVVCFNNDETVYFKIRCLICKANARVFDGRIRFFEGIPGLQKHVEEMHTGRLASVENRDRWCEVKPISDHDLERLRRGGEPVQTQIHPFTGSVRPNYLQVADPVSERLASMQTRHVDTLAVIQPRRPRPVLTHEPRTSRLDRGVQPPMPAPAAKAQQNRQPSATSAALLAARRPGKLRDAQSTGNLLTSYRSHDRERLSQLREDDDEDETGYEAEGGNENGIEETKHEVDEKQITEQNREPRRGPGRAAKRN